MQFVEDGILGLYGRTHFELDSIIDVKQFDELHLEICAGLSLAKPYAINGIFNNSVIQISEMSYDLENFTPFFLAYKKYQELSSDNQIKIIGEKIRSEYGNNFFITYLKYFYGAHDSYAMYTFWKSPLNWRLTLPERKLSEISQYFPSVVKWIDSLVDKNIFTYISRVYITAIEGNGISFEHRDPPSFDNGDLSNEEFIHIRPDLKRPFYIYNPKLKEKIYINSRIAWWNDKDIHGGDPTIGSSYAIRIDGLFTTDFKNKIVSL